MEADSILPIAKRIWIWFTGLKSHFIQIIIGCIVIFGVGFVVYVKWGSPFISEASHLFSKSDKKIDKIIEILNRHEARFDTIEDQSRRTYWVATKNDYKLDQALAEQQVHRAILRNIKTLNENTIRDLLNSKPTEQPINIIDPKMVKPFKTSFALDSILALQIDKGIKLSLMR